MKFKMKQLYILILSGILLITINLTAQEIKTPIEEMSREEIMNLTLDELLEMDMEDLVFIAQKLGISIDDLLKMKTTVASKTESTPRETPGIISIITEDEIKKSGARELIDVLYLIPGINFAWDADGVVGIQMRGNWAFEGKVSIMIDGQEMNDLKYYIVPFGHHFSVDQIQRIEVIRGPGSSIYGGTAELGVINIITKSGADINGAEATVSYGAIAKAPGNIRAALNLGEKRGDFTYSLTGSLIDGNRSERTYHNGNDIFVSSRDSGAHMNSKNMNLGFSFKDLSIKAIYDDYTTEYTYDMLYRNNFKTWLGEVKYDWKIGDNLVVTPRYNFRRSIPYYDDTYWANTDLRRNEVGISANYTFSGGSNITAGMNYYNDAALSMERTDSSYIYFENDSTFKLTFNNFTAFAQALIKVGKYNFVIGSRFDNHSEYGNAFAPRLGVTRIFDKLHFKVLLSRAFRSPSFGNVIFEPDIKPEYTWVGEIETGYRLNDNMFATANLFYTQIENSIVWYDSSDYSYGYTNGGKTGTYGLELEYRALYEKGAVTLNYSFYSCKGINEVDTYIDSTKTSRLMGSPTHKLSLSGNYSITRNSWISPSLIFWSGANSYGGYDSDGNDLGYIWFDPVFMANLSYTIHFKSFDISAGIRDIFNSHKYYLQGYVGSEPPFPAPSREYILKLSYKFNTKK
jgi:outer membrane receptor for ferrienterochelin and colicin